MIYVMMFFLMIFTVSGITDFVWVISASFANYAKFELKLNISIII